ncbi:hypothetical protein DVA67_000375 [Solirubrobacter sp. CPCC 204708]|uniref:DUF2238 domain-containing protein n=1 Tax=Solirubrobacter deserti TaxID=2282478 RepID=A0ABT4RMA5_9ACTN|nr:hypothetical protein [Solirubrobacter deserti]MBE2314412.1 hypothetical protein [Solirubrobacter deserti]MDA0139558.1 hypothetical protein [Solirubrobacter deserti]
MATRRLLLGDWHPWVRDPIDLLRWTLVAGAAIFAALGDSFAATLLGGAAALAWLVRPVLLPRAYDLFLVLALTLQAWGEALGFYDTLPWFDNIVHFSLPFFFAPTLYIVLARLDVVPDPRDETHGRHYAGIAIITFALGVALGGLWELWEYFSDRTLGSSLQIDNTDTVGDLAADSLGSAAGAALLVVWARWGWGSVRRIPGENRFEAAK